jgi:DNA mismatch repair protein MutS
LYGFKVKNKFTVNLKDNTLAEKVNEIAETPLMKQYNQIKAKHPDALLLFRVGDFYETFGSDAVKASKILGIILTKRKNGSASHIELAGFPHHSLETYLPKLVKAGQRVAICDQLEDPKMTKTIVKRGVTELVTPGVAFNDQVLSNKQNNFLASVQFGKDTAGVAFMDISTGEFLVAEGNEEYIDKLLQSFKPSEVLYPKNRTTKFKETFGTSFYTFKLEDWVYSTDFAQETLNKQFSTASLKGFGIDHLSQGIIAAGAILHYLSETQHDRLAHITRVNRIEEDHYVWLDRFTIRNLELLHSQNDNATVLIDIIDKTKTPMGGRLLKRWLVLPLKDQKIIQQRLDSVEYLVNSPDVAEKLSFHLNQIGDLERLISKVAVGRINPKEIIVLKNALRELKPIKSFLGESDSEAIKQIVNKLDLCEELLSLIDEQLHPEPAIMIGKGSVIADGFHAELDELRKIAFSGKDFLEQIQERESELTGIPSLKIAFNNVFGYYIEVRNSHKDKVPDTWIRKQTLVNAERYITEELKVYESKILGAEDRIHQLEAQLLQELILSMAPYIETIQKNAQRIALLDCLLSFSTIAIENNYTKPEINSGKVLDIQEGRHPVIEKQLPLGEEYISNNVYLSPDDQQIIMITGPNMSGKSAILRQTALITLLAQIGSFVPAKKASIGIVDKIFTRVGASDNISSGESTFMVEMNETASILNNVTDRSLVLLDEIGRGTSTYDGISIAWAIAEYLHEHPNAHCKTLFATHYHELNEMTNQFSRIRNFNVAVKEIGNKIIFLRKLVEGGSEHSFGIHVAKMAGMPKQVIQRATKMLVHLEKTHKPEERNKVVKAVQSQEMQLSIFQLDDPVLQNIKEELISIDINTLTPVEALMKLNEIKKLVGVKG